MNKIIGAAILIMLISLPFCPLYLNPELLEVAGNGRTGTVKLRIRMLLRNGANPNAKRHVDGVTALMRASKRGHTQTVKALLDAGADVDAKNHSGFTALMFVRNGGTEIVQILLDAGADLDAKEHDGTTPLMAAAATGESEIVQALVEAGAGVNAKNSKDYSALMLAEEEGYPEIIELLKKAGAKE